MKYTTYFATVPEWLLGHVSANAIALYCILDRHTDRYDACFPARRTLADKMQVSLSTVDRATAELKSTGALLVQPRRRTNGSQTSNEYVLRRDPPVENGQLELVMDEAPLVTGDDPSKGSSRVTTPELEDERKPKPLKDGLTVVRPPLRGAANGRSNKTDELWDELTEALGEPATPSERGRRNKALRELRSIGVTREELRQKIEWYRREWPEIELTATALTSNWSLIGRQTENEKAVAARRQELEQMHLEQRRKGTPR